MTAAHDPTCRYAGLPIEPYWHSDWYNPRKAPPVEDRRCDCLPHEPLCWYSGPGNDDPCLCEVIAKVREEDLRKLSELLGSMRRLDGPDATAATDAFPDLTMGDWLWCQRGVGRAIQALGGTP